MPELRIHNPVHDIYPATPDYAHAVEVVAPRRLLLDAADRRSRARLAGSAPRS